MNERIKELAMELAEQLDWNPPHEPTYYTFAAEDLEKFAELIVRECASICDVQEYKYSFTPAKARLAESTVKHCGTLIKQHFGVE